MTIQNLLKKVPHITSRPYRGGVEIRTQNLEQAKLNAEKLIKANEWPLEIFETDVRLRSFSVRSIHKISSNE